MWRAPGPIVPSVPLGGRTFPSAQTSVRQQRYSHVRSQDTWQLRWSNGWPSVADSHVSSLGHNSWRGDLNLPVEVLSDQGLIFIGSRYAPWSFADDASRSGDMKSSGIDLGEDEAAGQDHSNWRKRALAHSPQRRPALPGRYCNGSFALSAQ